MIRIFLTATFCCVLTISTVQADELEYLKGQISQTVSAHENDLRTGANRDFINMDKDEDSCVTFEELNSYFHQDRVEENQEMFEYIDMDSDDCITQEEMSQFVNQTITTITNR